MDTVPSIENLLDALQDLIEESKPVIFGGDKRAISAAELEDIIADIRQNLPTQIRQAEKIISNCNKTVGEANNQAKTILDQARTQAQQLTSEHEITKLAQEEAERIIDEAYAEAKNLRQGAKEYIRERMEETERCLNEMMTDINDRSREFQNYLSGEVDKCYSIKQELLDRPAPESEQPAAEDDYEDYDDDEY